MIQSLTKRSPLILMAATTVFFGRLLIAEPRPEPPKTMENRAAYECSTERASADAPGSLAPLEYEVCVAKDFGEHKGRILREGFKEFTRRLVQPEVQTCFGEEIPGTSQKEALAGLPDGLRPQQRLVIATEIETYQEQVPLDANQVFFFLKHNVPLPPGPVVTKTQPKQVQRVYSYTATVFIVKSPAKTDSVASGYLDYFRHSDKLNPGVVPGAPGPEKPAWAKHLVINADSDTMENRNIPYGDKPFFWAAALGQAYLVNMGVPESAGDLRRSRLYHYGRCLLWQGKIPAEYRDSTEDTH